MLYAYCTLRSYAGCHSKGPGIIERMLDRLDAALKPEDMNIPGYRFRRLTGERKDTYSVTVTGNWRITFRFDGEDAIILNLEDYH